MRRAWPRRAKAGADQARRHTWMALGGSRQILTAVPLQVTMIIEPFCPTVS